MGKSLLLDGGLMLIAGLFALSSPAFYQGCFYDN